MFHLTNWVNWVKLGQTQINKHNMHLCLPKQPKTPEKTAKTGNLQTGSFFPGRGIPQKKQKQDMSMLSAAEELKRRTIIEENQKSG
jgi:hypothetical protein